MCFDKSNLTYIRRIVTSIVPYKYSYLLTCLLTYLLALMLKSEVHMVTCMHTILTHTA